jgi:hypothetical protein
MAIRWVVPVLAALLGLAGCASAGGLHDAGPTQPPPAAPSPVALWPAADVAPAASPTRPAPAGPLPGLTVAGDDIQQVDPRTVLDKDPAVTGDERAALHGCPGCTVYPAQYRDLTGEGDRELLVAVRSDDRHSYLHVYRLREHGVLPLLAVPVQSGFRADTVGHDLEVDEPAGPGTDTRTVYHWNPQLAAFGRLISSSGPDSTATDCLPAATPTPWPGKPLPSAIPSYAEPKVPVPAPTRPATPPLPGTGPTAMPGVSPGAAPPPRATATPSSAAVPMPTGAPGSAGASAAAGATR